MVSSCFASAFVSALALVYTVDLRAQGAHWNQWRGPGRDGHVSKAAWPARLDGRLEKLWSVPLGRSYSGPVVDADTVYTTESTAERSERVRAFDRASGEQRWQAEWKGHMKVPFFANRNGSWIRSTPIVDETSIYVGGMPDILACLDKKTGKERWRLDLRKDLRQPMQAFGFVCSPLLEGKHLFVQAGGGLLKLDKATGALVWRGLVDKGGMMSGGAFSSPVVATIAGKRQLLVQTRVKLCGVDLDDGRELWGRPVKTFRGMNILTPLASGDGVFTSAYGGRGHYFDIKRRSGKDEALQGEAAQPGAAGRSGNESGEERDTSRGAEASGEPKAGERDPGNSKPGTSEPDTSKRGASKPGTSRPGASQGAAEFAVAERWNNRAQGYMTSPVEIDGYVYLYLRSKRFCCVELASGDVAWISEPIGDEYASLVANDKRILALTSGGELYLLAHNPEKFQVLDRVEVAEQETWAHLAVDGEQILVRELEALTAYRWR